MIYKVEGGGGGTGTGMNGKSAYELWLEAGNIGSIESFFDSLMGDVGPQGPQGPTGPEGGSAASYLVELSRWGITQGIPSKPWVDSHYITADNNIQGINNAIQWACDNGYNYIVLPKGSYSICYPREIEINRSHMTLDLNGSVFKVLYDSDTKSPFDNRTTSDYYQFQGQSFTFINASHSHLINGKIFGERLDRSFSNNEERAIEWTTGVQFTKGSSYCSVRHCEIAYYMADSVGFEPTAPAEYAEFGLTLTVNDLDKNTGEIIAATGNTLITQMIPIPAGTFNVFSITGQGFTRPTGLISKDVGVYYYRTDNSFICSIQNQKIYTPMTIPVGAAKYKLIFYNETDATRTSSNQLAIHLKFGLNPHHNLVEWNEIYGNHRGGIQPGGSENIIQYNAIHDIGTSVANGLDIYGKPLFNDPTRYGINQEDFFGDAVTIRNNLIYSCYCGILCGNYNATIENNRIYNAGNIGINLYVMLKGSIRNNFVWKCTSSIGLMSAGFANAHIEISSNTIVGGNTDWRGDGVYQVIADKNTFIDVNNITALQLDNDMHVFRNNHIKFNSYYAGSPVISVNRIEGWTFDVRGTSQKTITINTFELINCSFSYLILRIYGRDTTKKETVKIYDCKFNNCIVEAGIANVSFKRDKLDINRSKLTDTQLRVANLNTTENPTITMADSEIFIKNLTYLCDPQINISEGYGIVSLDRCNIEISTGFQYLIKNNYTTVPSTLSFSMKKCNVNFTGSPNLNLIYYSHKTTMKEFVSVDNTYIGVVLPAEDSGYFVGYDILKKFKPAAVTLVADGANFSTVVTHNLNTLEPYVFCTSSSVVINPTVTLIDANTLKITHSQNISINLTICKI